MGKDNLMILILGWNCVLICYVILIFIMSVNSVVVVLVICVILDVRWFDVSLVIVVVKVRLGIKIMSVVKVVR